MILNLKKTTKYLLIASLVSIPLFAIKIENGYDAVDVAGKQRMYTQRMLKDYAMIGMKNSFGNPAKDLKVIVDAFDDHLEELHNYAKKSKTKKSTQKVKKLWVPIKKILTSEPNKKDVSKLQESLDRLLDAANETTGFFAKEAGKNSGEIVDISGRQRMLSQRMASLYMLKVWGINDKNFKDKMQDSMGLFKDSLELLQQSKYNTKEIDKRLGDVERAFKFFEVMNKSKSIFIPSLIYKKSNDILKSMNIVTHCYVDQCKEEN